MIVRVSAARVGERRGDAGALDQPVGKRLALAVDGPIDIRRVHLQTRVLFVDAVSTPGVVVGVLLGLGDQVLHGDAVGNVPLGPQDEIADGREEGGRRGYQRYQGLLSRLRQEKNNDSS